MKCNDDLSYAVKLRQRVEQRERQERQDRDRHDAARLDSISRVPLRSAAAAREGMIRRGHG